VSRRSRVLLPLLLYTLACVLILAAGATLAHQRTQTPALQFRCGSSGEAPPSATGYPLRVLRPLAADGVVYVGYAVPGTNVDQPQTVIAALRASDGTPLWTVPDTNGTGELAFADGNLLLFGSGIVALRASDGASLWRSPFRPYDGVGPWAIDEGVLYFLHSDVYALRISDGRILWQHPVQHPGTFLIALVVDGATVYVGSANGYVMALAADTGALLWKAFPTYPTPATNTTPPEHRSYAPLAVVAGQLYVRLTDGVTIGFLRIDPSNGDSAAYDLPAPRASATTDLLPTPLFVANGILVVGIQGPTTGLRGQPDIAAYRLLPGGGKRLWYLPANGLFLTEVSAYDAQTLYLKEPGYGFLVALRLTDGAVLWRRPAYGSLSSAFGSPGAAVAAMGTLFETAAGVADPCHSYVDQAPSLHASTEADGLVMWTRALSDTTR
jgi:outer membrane protein assembly factor BamB